jgi:hypothetical protein
MNTASHRRLWPNAAATPDTMHATNNAKNPIT